MKAVQARRKWSQYQFFTKRIEDSMANGMMAFQAIHELDALRGSRTLPQLHRELQPKGRKKKSPIPTASVDVEGHGGMVDEVPVDVAMDASG
jgi:hypothetical protein